MFSYQSPEAFASGLFVPLLKGLILMITDKKASWFLRNLPNFITSLRIVGTAGLLFIEPFSALFYAVYTLSGMSDAVDGWLARKLDIVSDFGSKLDSAADLMFYAMMIIRIFPVLWVTLPKVIWIGVGAVVALRLVSYAVAAVKYHRFASLHTLLNKITGAAVFALPYIIKTSVATPFCWGLCALSGAGTLQELTMHLRSKEYGGE